VRVSRGEVSRGEGSRGNRVLNDQDLVLSVNHECNEQGCSSPAGTVCRPINEVTNNGPQSDVGTTTPGKDGVEFNGAAEDSDHLDERRGLAAGHLCNGLGTCCHSATTTNTTGGGDGRLDRQRRDRVSRRTDVSRAANDQLLPRPIRSVVLGKSTSINGLPDNEAGVRGATVHELTEVSKPVQAKEIQQPKPVARKDA